MIKSKDRPTWDLDREARPATLPAAGLDPDEAVREALLADAPHDRHADVTTLVGAAINFAAESMRDALAELAFRARDLGPEGGLRSGTGWRAFWEPGPHGSNIDLVMTHEREPGGWHLSVRFAPVLTEPAADRVTALEAAFRVARPGLSPRELLMARIVPGKDDPTLSELSLVESDPASYRPAARGDRLEIAYATALDLGPTGWRGIGPGGRPARVEEVADARTFLPVRAYERVWWGGLQLTLKPVPAFQRHEGRLIPNSERPGACPEMPLRILSDLIRSAGLGDEVRRRSEEAGQLPWISYGDERHVLVEEAGHAMVHAAGGMWDRTVDERLSAFWSGIAAQDVERHLDGWFALAPQMAKSGYGSGGEAFSCNDGRDVATGATAEGVRSLRTRTQNGTYRVDMTEAEDGGVARVLAVRESGGRDIPIGRFIMTGTGLRPDFGPENGPAIEHDIRTVRDLNGVIGSLASAACAFEEARIVDEETPEP